MKDLKINNHISEGLISINNAKIKKPSIQTFYWNPKEYKITNIDLENGKIIIKALEERK